MGFFGKSSVIETERKQPKKTTSVLYKRSSGDTFATGVNFSSYIYPIRQTSGLGSGGSATESTTIVLYRIGQTVAPVVEDRIIDSQSRVWLIVSVNPRLTEHESQHYAVYDCMVYRMA